MYICIHTFVEARVANPPVSTSLGLGLQISNVHYRTCFVFLRGEWSWALNLDREACMARLAVPSAAQNIFFKAAAAFWL